MRESITLLSIMDPRFRGDGVFGERGGVPFVGVSDDAHAELHFCFLDRGRRQERLVVSGEGDHGTNGCHRVGRCRCELCELDEVMPELRLRDDKPFLVLPGTEG